MLYRDRCEFFISSPSAVNRTPIKKKCPLFKKATHSSVRAFALDGNVGDTNSFPWGDVRVGDEIAGHVVSLFVRGWCMSVHGCMLPSAGLVTLCRPR